DDLGPLAPLATAVLALPQPDAEALISALQVIFPKGWPGRTALRAALPASGVLGKLDLMAFEVAARQGSALLAAARLAEVAARLTPAAPSGLTLDDLHGQPELSATLARMARDLQRWRDGGEDGHRLDWRNVTASAVLYGPPGNGKTLAARALAGSLGVPLVETSYADCQRHGHQGQMLAALCGAFDRAIRCAPSVLFLDEIDAFGCRGTDDRNSRYMNGVITGLLEQVNRLAATEGVLFLAATNRIDDLDPAILRSGRFDRKIRVEAPDRTGILRILAGALRAAAPGGLLAPAELGALADQLVGLSGADVAAIVREAASQARDAGRSLSRADLARAADAVVPPLRPGDLARMAVHEAGHALVATLSGRGAGLTARIGRLGGEVMAPEPPLPTLPEAEATLRILLAGRVAEELVLGHPCAGSGRSEESDLARATDLAWRIDRQFGFGRTLAWHPAPPADAAPAVEARLQSARAQARALIEAHRPALDRLAAALRARREMGAGEIGAILADLVPGEAREQGHAREEGEVEATARVAVDGAHDGNPAGLSAENGTHHGPADTAPSLPPET
ncbi:MAG: AAA family ATPase, partial [Aestuariivirga sp.]